MKLWPRYLEQLLFRNRVFLAAKHGKRCFALVHLLSACNETMEDRAGLGEPCGGALYGCCPGPRASYLAVVVMALVGEI